MGGQFSELGTLNNIFLNRKHYRAKYILITQEDFGTQLFRLTWENILSSAILNKFHCMLKFYFITCINTIYH